MSDAPTKSTAGWAGAMRAGAQAVQDLVFPPVCLGCGGVCEATSPLRHVCEHCVPTITRVRRPHCETCGHPFFGEVEGERICPHCEGLFPAYGTAKTVTLFKGVARRMVIELKYHEGLHVLRDMGALLAMNEELVELVAGATLVPVPMHPRKFRDRGFNQSVLWAEEIAQAVPEAGPVSELLERVQDSESQTAYDRRTRRKRMKNAFAGREGTAITAESRYILVDDVFTTGSTLNACAHALRRAGAVSIDVITFAHG
ncbi:ComF family protein [Actomonas aquatica]|uniref:ComF family protein n=1 Tax=Actomonas aquatica TaxID=2866162 RepID=A0ABZ1CAA3_9BACT|nr:ComF family protein [Opitutus sp. WL0086]WRQ88617.1 ComF family protein [Opitutus sp. WL0086]